MLHILACIIAITRSLARIAARPIFAGDVRVPRPDLDIVYEDLPEGFHNDIDSITVAVGGRHTCALEYRPGVDFGGPVRCWGRDDYGQSSPSDEIFVQVSAVASLRDAPKRYSYMAMDRAPCNLLIVFSLSVIGAFEFTIPI